MSSSILRKLCLASAISLALGGCASSPNSISASSEDLSHYNSLPSNDALTEVEHVLEKSNAKNLRFYAPAHYEIASAAITDARKHVERNAPQQLVAQKAAVAETMIRNGERIAKKVQSLLVDEIQIKNNIDQQTSSSEIYASEYSSLLERLSNVIRSIENGKVADANELRPQLIEDMQELEIRAVRYDALNDAEETLKRVKNSGAEKLAPLTYAEAVAVFNKAEEFILANANDAQQVRKIAAEATFAAKRALYIGDEVAAVSYKSQLSLEQVVLDEEYRLFRISRSLGLPDPRNNSLEVQSEILTKATKNFMLERDKRIQITNALRDTLTKQAENNREQALSDEIASLKKEHGELLAKEALYSSSAKELKQQLVALEQRALKAENTLVSKDALYANKTAELKQQIVGLEQRAVTAENQLSAIAIAVQPKAKSPTPAAVAANPSRDVQNTPPLIAEPALPKAPASPPLNPLEAFVDSEI
jgi:hypothetical protein